MAHEVFGERFLGRRDAAWHKIGTVIPADEVLSVTDAFKRAGLDFGFDRIPLIVDYHGTQIDTGKYAIIRQQTPDSAPVSVGVVSHSYDFLTNMEIAAKIDPLAEQWQVETVGALKNGATMFAMLNAGDQQVCGEECKTGFLVTDARDGSGAMKIAFVTTRVVCANTLAVALDGAVDTTVISHAKGIGEEVDFWIELLPKMKLAQENALRSLESFGERKLTKIEAKDIFEIAFPTPVLPRKLAALATLDEATQQKLDRPKAIQVIEAQHVADTKRAELMQESAFQNWIKIGKDFPKIRNTAWAALNSVTEIVDHGGAGNEKQAAESATFGIKANIKNRTYKALHELVTA